MSKRKTSYPHDEFDVAPGAIRRSGVHRGSKSVWSQVWPYLLALVLAVGVGFGSIYALMQSPDSKVNELINDATGNASQEPDEDTKDEPLGDDKGTGGEDPKTEETKTSEPDASETSQELEESEEPDTTEESEEPEPSATVNHAISVRVLNAGTVQGAAATAANKIKQDGFTSVEAANFEGSKPSSSVIYYKGADNKASAEQIGSVLGIPSIQEVDTLRADVSVVIR